MFKIRHAVIAIERPKKKDGKNVHTLENQYQGGGQYYLALKYQIFFATRMNIA